MKIKNILYYILGIAVLPFLLQGCEKPDAEFVHTTNTISQMICCASHGGTEFIGSIYEYDKDGNMVSSPDNKVDFTQEQIEGGYGLIIFAVSESLSSDVDLANIYLKATLAWDEVVTPSLSGRHDITGDGIIITVTSGTGTTRQYRVRGYYE